MTGIDYSETDQFAKDLKKLRKKFRSIDEDLEVAKKAAIELFHVRGIDNQSVFPIPGCSSDDVQIYKLKKFACKSLKGRGVKSGIRVIYAYHPAASSVEFIEIYHKGDKENENHDRIKDYLRTC
jgi:mRNA-degrading endonuclease RelE of RelBE toxin-antitoxin system